MVMSRVVALALMVAALFSRSLYAAPSTSSCPVTEPLGDVPSTVQCPANYGAGGLLVYLQPEIEFRPGGPGFVLPDGSLAWKFGWCQKVKGKLTIRGRRLDAPAPPVRANSSQTSDHPGFVPTHIIFPTEGCWEITGKAGNASVTFVTHVVDRHKRN